jgi:hypothetical protein
VIEAVKIRKGQFESGAKHIPSGAVLRSIRKLRVQIDEAGRAKCLRLKGRPPTPDDRRTARRKRRDPDDVDGVRAALVLSASPDDREEFVVCHFEEIARGKAIGGVQNVGLAPADELLAEIGGQRSLSKRRACMAQRERRALDRPVSHVDAPFAFHLLYRVDSGVD